MYGDKDRRLNSTTKAMQEYQQLPNESVRIYANRLKANWRRAGWSLIMHEVVLYDMAWAGLRHALKTKVRPWICSGKDRFDTLDQLFDCAAASEFKPDDKKPGGQQQQQSKHGSLRKVAIRNVISDHPSPNLLKTLPAIPITPAPVIQNRASPISPAEAAGPTYHQRRGFQRKPTKAERQTGFSPAVAAETTKPTFVPNTARQTHLNRTPAIAAAAMTANKLNVKSHSTRSSKKTSLPLSISNSTGEAG